MLVQLAGKWDICSTNPIHEKPSEKPTRFLSDLSYPL